MGKSVVMGVSSAVLRALDEGGLRTGRQVVSDLGVLGVGARGKERGTPIFGSVC